MYTQYGICRLDCITTVVDALRLQDEFACGNDLTRKGIDEEDIENLIIQQIEFCNIILLNKAAEVKPEELERIKQIIRTLQPAAEIIECNYADVDLKKIIHTDLFDFERVATSAGWIRGIEKPATEEEEKEAHGHHHHEEEHEHHHHDHDHECGCGHDHEEHEHHHHDHDEDGHECCHHHHDHDDDDDDEDEHEHHHHHDEDDDHGHECCHHHHDHDDDDDEDEHEHHHHDGECCCGHHHHHHDHDADEVFTSWGHETAHKYSHDELESILTTLDSGEYGAVLRAKGIVDGGDTWYEFDMVPGEHEIRTCGPDVTGKVCVIGSQLKEHEVEELFHA